MSFEEKPSQIDSAPSNSTSLPLLLDLIPAYTKEQKNNEVSNKLKISSLVSPQKHSSQLVIATPHDGPEAMAISNILSSSPGNLDAS